MRKYIAVFVGMALIATTLWFAKPGNTTRTVSAQTDPAEVENSSSPRRSRFGFGRFFRRSKPAPRKARTASSSSNNPRKKIVGQIMAEARQLARQGKTANAIKLAQRADSFVRQSQRDNPITFSRNEQSPSQFLAQMKAQQPRRQNGQGNLPVANSSRSQKLPTSLTQQETGRRRTDDLMRQAYAAIRNGNRASAVQLAKQADQFAYENNIRYSSNEMSPAQFLARVDSQESPSRSTVKLAGDKERPSNPFQVDPSQNITQSGVPAPEIGNRAIPANDTSSLELPLNTAPSQNLVSREIPSAPVIRPRSSDKEQAAALLAGARVDLQAGRYEEARAKTLTANEFDVVYDLFEDRPQILLSEIERQTGTTTIVRAQPNRNKTAKSPRSQFNGSETIPLSAEERKNQALQLLNQARNDLKASRFESAQQSAIAAQNLQASYGLFDDRPELVLTDISRKAARSNIARSMPASSQSGILNSTNPSAAGQNWDSNKKQASDLIRQARRSLKNGRLDEAQRLAIEAEELKSTYGLLEDRPSLVLADIQRISGIQQTGQSQIQTERPSQSVVQTTPSTVVQTTPSNNKQMAESMLQQARQHLKVGHLDAARQLATEAERFDVPYGLFDDRPDIVLADIARVEKNRSNVDDTSRTSPQVSELKQKVRLDKKLTQQLLQQARNDMKSGRFESARRKALEAKQADITYGIFDDRPDLVLADIGRIQATSNIAQADQKTLSEEPPEKPPSTTALPELGELVRQVAMEPADNRPVQQSPTKAQQAQKKQALAILSQARADIRAGRFEEARQKALQANSIDASYNVFDDQPNIVLADIERIRRVQSPASAMKTASTSRKKNSFSFTKPKRRPFVPKLDSTRNIVQAPLPDLNRTISASDPFQQRLIPAPPAEERPRRSLPQIDFNAPVENTISDSQHAHHPTTPHLAVTPPQPPSTPQQTDPYNTTSSRGDEIYVIQPSNPSALDLYRQGLEQLRRRNRDAAYESFLQAYQSGERLDPVRAQQLQDFLRELAPRSRNNVQLARNVNDGQGGIKNAAGSKPGQIDIVEQQRAVRFDRLRSEVLNAIFRAERLREKNPEISLEIIDQAMASVEGSDLGKQTVTPLVGSLRKTRSSIESYMTQMEPIVAVRRQKQEIESDIRKTQDYKIRVEQELANLVEEYNKLFKQRRYAEAELVAKEAKQLDPENPVTVTMTWKAKFARRNDSNERLRERKEEGFWDALDEVEQAAIPFAGPPMQFGDDWEEITNRRRGRYGVDNRNRTEEEKRIKKSLGRQISLHFEDVPLKEVIKHIATVADVNVVLDSLGLEEEGITTETPVSINVDGIMLKSALNLLLKPKNLDYTIEDEVLKITSRLRQQGRMVVATYPVADLVVPIPNFGSNAGSTMTGSGFGSSNGSFPNAQMSVPSMGGPQAQFQVGDGFSGAGAFNNSPWGNPSSASADLSGGGSAIDFDTLSDLIISTVEPDTWQEVGGSGSVRGYETTLSLVIRQTQQVHDEIADLLQQLRRLQDLQVTVEVRFINVSDRFFEQIGVDFDFNIPDNVGGAAIDNFGQPIPAFGSVIQAGAGMLGMMGMPGMMGMMGMGMAPMPMPFAGGGESGALSLSSASTARYMLSTTLPNQAPGMMMGMMAGMMQGMTGMVGMVGAAGGGGLFAPDPIRSLINTNNFPSGGTIVGMNPNNTFTQDLDIGFRQGSFQLGTPPFGGFDPSAGIQVGLAILSDIETFFFIQAAQGDRRSNILFAPKVTLFNGQSATVSNVTQRPFVTSVTPTVGSFSVGFTPTITVLNEGVTLFVRAVISADRRFVRLTVLPNFTTITDVETFTFSGGAGAGAAGMMGMMGMVGMTGMTGATGATGATGMPFAGGEQGAAIGFGSLSPGGGEQGRGAGALGVGIVPPASPTVTIQQPVQNIVNVTTTVSVPDGGTVLLGGVKSLSEGRNMSGVPILNKIPYISRLFKNTGVGRETRSLMLMVTPRIIIQEEEEELLGLPLD